MKYYQVDDVSAWSIAKECNKIAQSGGTVVQVIPMMQGSTMTYVILYTD